MTKVTQASSGRDSDRVDSAALQSIPMRWLTRVFGCWHKKMSPPYTGDGVTYRACMNCGARRQFDAGRGRDPRRRTLHQEERFHLRPAPRPISHVSLSNMERLGRVNTRFFVFGARSMTLHRCRYC